jgi:hypothetical protein
VSKKFRIEHLSGGFSQQERQMKELEPDYVLLDERNLSQRISFFIRYVELLNYYSYDSTTDEVIRKDSWVFITKHPIFKMAELAGFNMQKIRLNGNLVQSVFSKRKRKYQELLYALRLLFDTSTNLLKQFNQWLTQREDYTPQISSMIERSIADFLSDSMNELRAYALYHKSLNLEERFDYFPTEIETTFDKTIWRFDSKDQLDEVVNRLQGENNLSKEDQIRVTYEAVSSIFLRLTQFANRFKRESEVELEALIKTSNHSPDVALIVTFFNLLQVAQTKLNGITKSHLDYYYRTLLGLKEKPAVPDSTYIVLELSANCSDLELPVGTLFSAGPDLNGKTIEYQSTYSAVFNQAKVSDLSVLCFVSNEILLPKTESKPSGVTGVFSKSFNSPFYALSSEIPVFGEDQLLYSENEKTMEAVQFGFALASDVFELKEGRRKFTVELFATSDSCERSLVEVSNLLNAQGGAMSVLDAINSVITSAFDLKLTGPKGWLSPSNVEVRLDKAVQTELEVLSRITFSFEFSESDVSIVPYNSKLHGEGYVSESPIFKVCLSERFPILIYQLLKGLNLLEIGLKCEVEGYSHFSLYNPNGKVDTSKPFQILGIQPEVNAYLMIGSAELFRKKLTQLDFIIDWQGISSPEFLDEYYSEYRKLGISLVTSDFKIETSVLTNGLWSNPEGTSQELFAFQPNSSPSGFSSKIRLKEDGLDLISGAINDSSYLLTDPLKLGPDTKTGFLKFELSSPKIGFGAGVYPALLSNVAFKNAKILSNQDDTTNGLLKELEVKFGRTQILATPSAPYTPVAKRISANFVATETIDLRAGVNSKDKKAPFWHIDSFSTHLAPYVEVDEKDEENAGNIKKSGAYIMPIPKYTATGYLYVGISDLILPGTLELLFVLDEQHGAKSLTEASTIKWSYSLGQEWIKLVEAESITDGTNGLRVSGIVAIKIAPTLMSPTVLSPGKVWIRAELHGEIRDYNKLNGVYTQAMKVVCVDPNSLSRHAPICLKGQISKLIKPLPQVKSIVQPINSSGGALAEAGSMFYSRISERIRHRNRAVNIWDYEHIVLSEFPEVYRARCVSKSTNDRLSNIEGLVELVVVPNQGDRSISEIDLQPMFGPSELKRMSDKLSSMTSMHVNINVRNPIYEQIKVRCFVMFDVNDSLKLERLNKDITMFISPWSFGKDEMFDAGSSIQISSIIAFIQSLDYVSFLTGFSLVKVTYIDGAYHFYDSAIGQNQMAKLQRRKMSNPTELVDIENEWTPLTPYSIFTSAPKHDIAMVSSTQNIQPAPLAIGDLGIGSDFIIGDSEEQISTDEAQTLYVI